MAQASPVKKTKSCFVWFFGGLSAILIIVFLLIVNFLNGCRAEGYSEFERVPTPDGQFEAVVFQIDMGATTGYNRQVKIVRKGDHDPQTDSFYVFNGESSPTLTWISNNELVVNGKDQKTFNFTAPWFGRTFTVHGPKID